MSRMEHKKSPIVQGSIPASATARADSFAKGTGDEKKTINKKKETAKRMTPETIRALVRSHAERVGATPKVHRAAMIQDKIAIRQMDDDMRNLLRQTIGETEIRVRCAADFAVVGTSAATNGFSLLWDPTAVADFVLFTSLFDLYTLHSITMHFTSVTAVQADGRIPEEFRTIVADDATEAATTLTETEALNFPNMQVFNGNYTGHLPYSHVVHRKTLLGGLSVGTSWAPGGWVDTTSVWQGQTVGISRFGAAVAISTNEYLRVAVVWDVSFKARFT